MASEAQIKDQVTPNLALSDEHGHSDAVSIRVAVCSTARRWDGIFDVDAGGDPSRITIGETDVLYFQAPHSIEESKSRTTFRNIADQIREQGIDCVLVLCSGPRAETTSDLLVVEDHINWTGDNPLIGMRSADCGERFVDMVGAYDPMLRNALQVAAHEADLPVQTGIAVEQRGELSNVEAIRSKPRTQVKGLVPLVIAARQAGARVGAVAMRMEESDELDGTSSEIQGLEMEGLRRFTERAVSSLAALSGV